MYIEPGHTISSILMTPFQIARGAKAVLRFNGSNGNRCQAVPRVNSLALPGIGLAPCARRKDGEGDSYPAVANMPQRHRRESVSSVAAVTTTNMMSAIGLASQMPSSPSSRGSKKIIGNAKM